MLIEISSKWWGKLVKCIQFPVVQLVAGFFFIVQCFVLENCVSNVVHDKIDHSTFTSYD